MDNKNNETKLLRPELLSLLGKDKLTETEIKILVTHISQYCYSIEKVKRNDIYETSFAIADSVYKPIAQVGFELSADRTKFNHLITFNMEKLMSFPIERVVMIICHEFGHLVENDRLAKNTNFQIEEELKSYIASFSRKEEDWYSQESEYSADLYGYDSAKNIYQRAIHDSELVSDKLKFGNSLITLMNNEELELSKHRESMDRIQGNSR